MTWRRVDLHLHTPASRDYQETGVSPLDILRRAEERGLEIVAFTDHNSVRGYAEMWREIEDLELLEYLERLQPAEDARLREYRRLLSAIRLLPGFEFTATFGFHILAIFPEQTSVRLMEHLLLLLGVPEERFGSGEVGATSDVLRAYETLADHGALVIGAHVNSTHGIAMQGLRFGGQTKIAYTQDPHLHALEVTDLAVGPHRRSTARFFSGTKAEYARRMHCIQGSDAHRLDRDPVRETNLGVGDRSTEVLLPEVSFQALKALFLSDDFDRTRPFQEQNEAEDEIRLARAEGNTLVQAFHENLSTKRTGVTHVLRDVVALANAGGGTVYIGASSFEKRPVVGVSETATATTTLTAEIAKQIAPLLAVTIDTREFDGKSLLAIQVPPGSERPYALDPVGIFVRDKGESKLASRDQIVAMVRAATSDRSPTPGQPPVPTRHQRDPLAATTNGAPESSVTTSRQSGRRRAQPAKDGQSQPAPPIEPVGQSRAESAVERLEEYLEDAEPDAIAPKSGIEVLYAFEQDGELYYTVQDLRDEKLAHNVTRHTTRRIWRSAIVQREEQEIDESQVRWRGDFGLWRSYRPRGGNRRYHLVYRGDGDLRVFYGVSEEGMDDRWRGVIPARQTP